MASLLWECITISLVLLLGINIGLAMGLSKLSRGKIVVASILYGVILLAVSILVDYTSFLYKIADAIIPYVAGIIGIVTIINGIYTITRWKRDKKDQQPLLSLTVVVPSVCCFIGFFFFAMLLNSNNTEPDYLLISLSMVILFAVIIALLCMFSNFLRYARRPYPVLFGNFTILNGFLFLIIGLFIPTIKTMATLQTKPITIDVSPSLFFLLLAAVGVLLMGVYLTREGKTV